MRTTGARCSATQVRFAKQFSWTGIVRRGAAPSVIRFRELAEAAVMSRRMPAIRPEAQRSAYRCFSLA